MSSLNIYYQCAAGLKGQRLKDFKIACSQSKFDVVCITMSSLRKSKSDEKVVDTDKFDIFRLDYEKNVERNYRTWGTFIAVSKHLSAYVRREWQTQGVDCVWVTVPQRECHGRLHIACVNFHESLNIDTYTETLISLSSRLPRDQFLVLEQFPFYNRERMNSYRAGQSQTVADETGNKVIRRLHASTSLAGLGQFNNIKDKGDVLQSLVFSSVPVTVTHCPSPLVPEEKQYQKALQFHLNIGLPEYCKMTNVTTEDNWRKAPRAQQEACQLYLDPSGNANISMDGLAQEKLYGSIKLLYDLVKKTVKQNGLTLSVCKRLLVRVEQLEDDSEKFANIEKLLKVFEDGSKKCANVEERLKVFEDNFKQFANIEERLKTFEERVLTHRERSCVCGETSTANTGKGLFGATPQPSTGLSGQQTAAPPISAGRFEGQQVTGTVVNFAPLIMVQGDQNHPINISYNGNGIKKESEDKSLKEDDAENRNGSQAGATLSLSQTYRGKPAFGASAVSVMDGLFGQSTNIFGSTTNLPTSAFGATSSGSNAFGFGRTASQAPRSELSDVKPGGFGLIPTTSSGCVTKGVAMSASPVQPRFLGAKLSTTSPTPATRTTTPGCVCGETSTANTGKGLFGATTQPSTGLSGQQTAAPPISAGRFQGQQVTGTVVNFAPLIMVQGDQNHPINISYNGNGIEKESEDKSLKEEDAENRNGSQAGATPSLSQTYRGKPAFGASAVSVMDGLFGQSTNIFGSTTNLPTSAFGATSSGYKAFGFGSTASQAPRTELSDVKPGGFGLIPTTSSGCVTKLVAVSATPVQPRFLGAKLSTMSPTPATRTTTPAGEINGPVIHSRTDAAPITTSSQTTKATINKQPIPLDSGTVSAPGTDPTQFNEGNTAAVSHSEMLQLMEEALEEVSSFGAP